MRVHNPEPNDTIERFHRTLTSAFGPYAGQDPIYGPEDDVNTPYNLGDLCVVAVVIMLLGFACGVLV